MAKTPRQIRIKPATVDVGRGPQLATVPYPPGPGRGRVLPAEGDTVSLEGAGGSYWTRRINEGSVVKVEPAKAPAAERSKKGDE